MAKMVVLSRPVRPQGLPGEKRYSFGRGRSLDLRVSTAVSIRKGVDLVPIIISTRHGHVSEATQDKIREKLERLTRFYDRIISMELTIDLEHREQPRVDLRASAKDKHNFLASAATEDREGFASVTDGESSACGPEACIPTENTDEVCRLYLSGGDPRRFIGRG
jgi:ribosome-associated translation inhibitor RaiA